MNQEPDSNPTSAPLSLSMDQRQAMMEALYRRYISGGDAACFEPSRLARAAVMSDEDLLSTLQAYEGDGDREIAKVLAALGLSDVPVHVELPAVRAAESTAGPDAVAVEISVSQLRRFEMDHFAVRDMAEFGSLRLDLPRGTFCLGYFSGHDVAEAGLLLDASVVLTNGTAGEAMIAFEVERAVRNQLDVAYRSVPVALSHLRGKVAQAVGAGEVVSLVEGVERALWVYCKDLESDPSPRPSQREH